MGNSKIASENSVWLKEYLKRTSGAKKKSNGNKKIILIIIPIMLAAVIGFMIYNGGLNDPQAVNTIKILGIIAAVIFVFAVIMIALGKKKNVTSRTEDNLNELFGSVEEVKDFDRQMAVNPVFKVEIDELNYTAATRDYLFKRFSDMGNETYTFIRLKDIDSLHYTPAKTKDVLKKEFYVDWRDSSGKVLMNGRVTSSAKLVSLQEGLQPLVPGIKFVQD